MRIVSEVEPLRAAVIFKKYQDISRKKFHIDYYDTNTMSYGYRNVYPSSLTQHSACIFLYVNNTGIVSQLFTLPVSKGINTLDFLAYLKCSLRVANALWLMA